MNGLTLEMSDLRFQIKLLRDKVAGFESGEKYIRMKEEFRKVYAADLRKIKSLEEQILLWLACYEKCPQFGG